MLEDYHAGAPQVGAPTIVEHMRLRELATHLGSTLTADPLTTITGVTHNAAWVGAGNVFVAIRGARADGHQFIDQALSRGALAVIGEGLPEGMDIPVPYLQVDDARWALAAAAAALEGYPSRELQVVGITGTDGKTTTSWLTKHLLRSAGISTGMLSTVGYELPDGVLRQFPDHFTTPESPQVQQILRELIDLQTRAVVLETSSHALALKRVAEVEFDVAVWTNLSREHLDFHGTVENYFEDKAALFTAAGFGVINVDDAWGRKLLERHPQAQTYSTSGARADWMATTIVEHPSHLSFDLHSPLGQAHLTLPMVGAFNVANALAALATAAHLGAPLEDLARGLESFSGVPGRMQLVSLEGSAGTHPRTIIDFAHTPAALENLLQTLRPSTAGKLWVLIGAPGRRDTTKRAPMGEVTTRLADIAIFTEDDPRDDPITHILSQMASGTAGRTNFHEIADRTEAITFAVTNADAEDTVVLAGKGAEMFIAREHGDDPWDETATALSALRARGG